MLRLGRGDFIAVLDNSGREFLVQLESLEREEVVGRIEEVRQAGGEPGARITLYQGLLKGDKLEMVLQKGTELGVAGFVPVLCQRCVAALPRKGKAGRWRRIIVEAAEQSRRGRLPTLHPTLPLAQACQEARGLSLLPWEGEAALGLRQALREGMPLALREGVNLFIGPEGGFAPEEVELAQGYGIRPVTLGPRVLRAETAALAAVAAVLYEVGEMGG